MSSEQEEIKESSTLLPLGSNTTINQNEKTTTTKQDSHKITKTLPRMMTNSVATMKRKAKKASVKISPQFVIFHLLFWSLHALVFTLGYYRQRLDPELRIFDNIGGSVFLARGAGLVLSVDCCLLILGVCRNFMTLLRSTPLSRIVNFEDHLYFHKWIAYSTLFFSVIHTVGLYASYFVIEYQLPQTKRFSDARGIHYTTWSGITGFIMLLCMFLMYTSARLQVRQKNFELFWYVHHLFIPFYVCVILHSSGCFVRAAPSLTNPDLVKCKGYNSIYGTLPCFLIYCFERLLRFYRAYLPTRLRKVVYHPGNTLELQIEMKSFKYKPGQYLFLNVPGASLTQWHPFTISSTPEEPFVSVHIRLVGDWTKKVAELCNAMDKVDGLEVEAIDAVTPRVCIDGPYGAPVVDLYNYKVSILIANGIGVTPAASMLKSVWYRFHKKKSHGLSKLYFIWINRDPIAFAWFRELLLSLESKLPGEKLVISLYLTGTQKASDIFQIAARDEEMVDPITSLKSKTHFGRPVWEKIFEGIREDYMKNIPHGSRSSKLKIGTFFCGPKQLQKQLALECLDASTDEIEFDFKNEKF